MKLWSRWYPQNWDLNFLREAYTPQNGPIQLLEYPILPSVCLSVTQKVSHFSGWYWVAEKISLDTWSG